ncbi:MAG: putative LPS assembly protein LptD [Bacteroidota bacterium]
MHSKLLIKIYILLFLSITQHINLFARVDTTSGINSDKSRQTRESAIKSKVEYSSEDSIRFNISEQKVYLFGKATVNYETITLEAAYIEFDLKNNILFAKGSIDSAGKETGKPVFEESGQRFNAKTITYNFETRKGLITQASTKEGEGFIHSDTAKKDEDDVYFIKNGTYTTCDSEHPHFGIKSSKLKVIPDDKIITGPAYLTIADIPTPLVLPFGIFPNKTGQASGILLPTYGESPNVGFYLKDGGYYFGISDNLDLAIRGDTYSKGNWALKAISSYKKRYKYSGNLSIGYSVFKFGEKEMPTYTKDQDFKITWKHDQDAKARPNSRFSANVNVASSTYNTYNSNRANDYLSNTFQSNISYSRSWTGKPYNLSVNLRHSQNTINKTVDLSIPEVVFSVNRFYPLKKRNKVGQQKWYEKIGVNYRMDAKNQISTHDSLLFSTSQFSNFKNGIKQSIPISTSIKILKYLTFTPSFNYTERWYLHTIEKNWMPDSLIIKTDTLSGFKRASNYIFNSSLITKIYGMVQFKSKRIKAIRHVLTPSVGFSYRPDFGADKWGYYKSYQTDTLGNTRTYSIFQDGIFGSPPSGKSGMINFSLSNNLEMKVRSLKDTITQTKKIVLIENLTISTSYNIAADSLNWSDITISGYTRLFKRLYIKYYTLLDPYVVDSNGVTVNKFEWKENKRIARITDSDWDFSLNLNLGPEIFKKKKSEKGTKEELEMINEHPDAYVDFNIPWSLNIDYSLKHTSDYIYSNNSNPDSISKNIIQSLNFNGDIKLTPKWKIGFRSGYDFINKKMTYTSIDFYRDLHCWELAFNWIPIGFRKSYNLSLNVKSSVLQDLKLTRKREWYDY